LKSSPLSQVYLKPDRTLEQRLKHREIVQELKKCIQNSPEKHHFIKNGEICHQEKPKEKSANNTESGSIDSEATRERKKPRKILLPHHIAANRRPPIGYISPVTTDSSDCE